MCVCVCVFCALCYGGLFVCVWACIFISMYTQIKLIYIRDAYIYIYISCARVCVSLGLLQVILSGEGDVPLFVTQPVTASSGNVLCTVCDRDSFQGVNDLPSWQFCGRGWVRLLEKAAGQSSVSLEVESSTLCSCVGLFAAGWHQHGKLTQTQSYLSDTDLFLLPALLLQREYTSKTKLRSVSVQ